MSNEMKRESYTCVSEAEQGVDGAYFPVVRIHKGESIAGEIVYMNRFPEMLCIDYALARRTGAEYIDAWLEGWKIQGAAQRDGVTYAYAGRVTSADPGTWEAKIYLDAEFCGQIGGVMVDHSMSSSTLNHSVRLLIETTVAAGIGLP